MISHVLKKGVDYVLKGRADVPEIIEVHHATGQIDHVLLPLDAFGRFGWLALEHDVELRSDSLSVTPRRRWFGRSSDPVPKIRAKARFAAPVRFGGCIYAFQKARKGPPRTRLHDNRGLDLGSEAIGTLLSSAMICDALPALPDGPDFEQHVTVAVVLHLHYPELWEEFATVLAHSKLTFRLIVTLTAQNPTLEAAIRARFKGASVQVLNNLGRDIRPFLHVLQSGALDDVDLICKLHGKRSVLSGATGSRFGHLWRRRNLLDLVGSPTQVAQILEAFETRPKVGMMGSAPLRLRNGNGPEPGFDASKAPRETLCKEAGLEPKHIKDDLFAGTMFWVRPEALAPLRHLSITDDLYTPETHQKGDQVEHALERFFGDCTRATGYILADIEPLTLASQGPLRASSGRLVAPRALWHGPNESFQHRWAKPLPESLKGQKIALIAGTDADGKALSQTGYVTALCLACPDPARDMDTTADALFLRDTGGFEIALWGAAFRTAPQLWQARELLFVSAHNKSPFHMLSLQTASLAQKEVRAFFETALSWTKDSEADFRYGSRIRALLDETHTEGDR